MIGWLYARRADALDDAFRDWSSVDRRASRGRRRDGRHPRPRHLGRALRAHDLGPARRLARGDAWWNAAAISGEYLSAASFLGIAGLRCRSARARCGSRSASPPATWRCCCSWPRRCAASAPTRSPTSPRRACAARRLRLVAAAIVLVIAGFYLVPQLKGAGLALNVVTGSPYWVGVVVVGAIVAVNVAIGGMRGITYVQAFQFWVKVFAIAVPAIVLLIHFGGLPERAALFGQRAAARGSARASPSGSSEPRARAVPATPAASSSRDHRVDVAGRRLGDAAGRRRCADPARTGSSPSPSGTPALPWQGLVASGRRHRSRRSPLLVYSLLIATFLGHDGPAARARALLHQPRRPRRAAHDRARARAAVDLLPVPGGLRRARPGADAAALHDRPDRRRRADAAADRLARRRSARS